MPRPTILAYNLPEARLGKLRFLCMKLGAAVKAVPAADCVQPIAALCGLATPQEAAQAEGFPDEMLTCRGDGQGHGAPVEQLDAQLLFQLLGRVFRRALRQL